MEKFQADPNNDIVKEPYKGSGPGVAIAGYAYLSHLGSMIAGLVAGGIIASFAHTPVNKAVNWARSFINGKNGFFRDKTIKFIFGSGKNTLEEAFKKIDISGLNPKQTKSLENFIAFEEMGLFERTASKAAKWLGKSKKAASKMESLSEEKLSAGFMGAGFGAALGYLGSSAWAIVKGGQEGSAGKKQFKRAQAEIASLRETNDNLEEIDNNLRAEYVKELSKLKEAAASPPNEKLRVSPDDVPATRSEGTAVDAAKPATTTSLKDASLQGTLAAAPELAATPA